MWIDLEKLKSVAERFIDGKAKIVTGDIFSGDFSDRIIKFREEATPEVVSSLIAEIERLRKYDPALIGTGKGGEAS